MTNRKPKALYQTLSLREEGKSGGEKGYIDKKKGKRIRIQSVDSYELTVLVKLVKSSRPSRE